MNVNTNTKTILDKSNIIEFLKQFLFKLDEHRT